MVQRLLPSQSCVVTILLHVEAHDPAAESQAQSWSFAQLVAPAEVAG